MTGKGKVSKKEINARIGELIKQSVKSEGVINLFSDVKAEFSIFDAAFLEEISKMKEKNIAIELLKKLLAERVTIYQKTNLVQAEKFSDLLNRALSNYLKGLLTNEEVIQELLKLAAEISESENQGNELGLTAEEKSFYDALTKPRAVQDIYERTTSCDDKGVNRRPTQKSYNRLAEERIRQSRDASYDKKTSEKIQISTRRS